jgi:sec-independent protein translocase protein TatB
MMKRMSFSETIFLFFLALVIFGPKKLPEIARQVGKVLNEFRRASNEFKAQIEQEIAHIEVEERSQTILPPSPAPEGTASRTLTAAPVADSSAQPSPAEPPAPAASEDEPLFARNSSASEPELPRIHPESAAVTSSSSRESHV